MESQDDIFLKAREIADTVQQAAYLAEACGRDAELRKRVDVFHRFVVHGPDDIAGPQFGLGRRLTH